MSPGLSPTIERTAACIRKWVAITGSGLGPKPVAHPHVSAGDPLALARIVLGAIHESIVGEPIALARLALIVGAAAEHEARGQPGGADWGTEVRVRVGLALIDCAMRATGWFVLVSGPRLCLEITQEVTDAARHRLGREVSIPDGRRPIIRDLAPPYRTIKTLMGGKCVAVTLAEAAGELADAAPRWLVRPGDLSVHLGDDAGRRPPQTQPQG